MSHRIPAMIAVIATAATMIALTTSGQAQTPADTVISYAVRDAGGTFVDSPPKGDSRGDFVAFEGRLLDASRVVGRERGTCIVANARTHATVCTMGWVIPGGTLTTTGTTPANPPFTLPIAGGTGRYAGARGTALIEKTKTTFRLLP